MSVLVMLLSAAFIILVVRYGLLAGIEHVANAMQWTAKTRGQVTGFATSTPELVCLIAAGLAGVWDAGLWNIASSNMINGGLMLIAVAWYGQLGELANRRFFDEVAFAVAAIAVPVVLMQLGHDTHWVLVPVLFGFFAVYRYVDARVNPVTGADGGDESASGNLAWGLILGSTALVCIAVGGMFLGDATRQVVEQMGIHPAIAGWILGTATSIPEMISFFAVYAASKEAGELDRLADTQEVLDNLASSNVANVGVVYPAGLLAFLVASALL